MPNYDRLQGAKGLVAQSASGPMPLRAQDLFGQRRAGVLAPSLIATGSSVGPAGMVGVGAAVNVLDGGYDVTPGPGAGGSSVHWYFDRDMRLAAQGGGQSKFYWEVGPIGAGDIEILGIAEDPTVVRSYLGYAVQNTGVYNRSTLWNEAAWGGSWTGAYAPAAGDIIGFAYDALAKKLDVYDNNAAVASITFSTGPAAAYAALTFQGNVSSPRRVAVGRLGCRYAPPTGYSYLDGSR